MIIEAKTSDGKETWIYCSLESKKNMIEYLKSKDNLISIIDKETKENLM